MSIVGGTAFHLWRPCSVFSSDSSFSLPKEGMTNRRRGGRRRAEKGILPICYSVTGGSKRDAGTFIARTQHRQPRNRKGGKLSKPELTMELDEGEKTEEELLEISESLEERKASPNENMQNRGSTGESIEGEGGGKGISTTLHGVYDTEKVDDGEYKGLNKVMKSQTNGSKLPQPLTSANVDVRPPGMRVVINSEEDSTNQSKILPNIIRDRVEKTERKEVIGNAWPPRMRDMIDSEEDGITKEKSAPYIIRDAVEDTENRAVETDASNKKKDLGGSRGKKASENGNGIVKTVDNVMETAVEVADVVADTSSDTSEKARQTLEEVGEDMSEIELEGKRILKDTGEILQSMTDDVVETAVEVADVVVDTASDTSENARETLQEVGEDMSEIELERKRISKDTGEILQSMVGDVIQTAVEVAGDVVDTSSYTSEKARETLQEVGEDMSEIESERKRISKDTGEILQSMVGDVIQTAVQVAGDVVDTSSYTSEKARETLQAVGEDMSEIESEVETILKDCGEILQSIANDVTKTAVEVADIMVDTSSYTSDKASETLQAVGEDMSEIELEGKSIVKDCGEILQNQSPNISAETNNGYKAERIIKDQEASILPKECDQMEKEAPSKSVGGKIRHEGESFHKTELNKEEKTIRQSSNDRYNGFKVLVAGASGRTGRLIVENLVSKGVAVHALVRDVSSLPKMDNVKVIKGDLYKFETLKQALGDCNVVICAIGAKSFLFDPLQTYQVEYEGLLNVISAAKNQGKVKKFILLSSIGVTFFQLIPLLFWKKQAELFLQRSGLDYTIIRPGGLRNGTNKKERIVICAPDTQFFGGISRGKVAEVCVEAMVSPDASDKIVEVVAESDGGEAQDVREIFQDI